MSLNIFPMFTKNLAHKLSVALIAIILSGITISTSSVVHKEEKSKETRVSYNVSMMESVFADETAAPGTPATPTPPKTDAKTSEALGAIVDVLNIFLSVLSFIMTPLIMFAGWLMSPDWTFGDIFNMRGMLLSLWVLVSNVVYVVFAFLLIFMAFRNIFGEAKDHFALKTGLPKLLTGIIMVPFTWFIVSGVLSVANYVTAATLRLPATIIKTDQDNKYLDEMWIPMDVVVDLKGNYGTGKVNELGESNPGVGPVQGSQNFSYQANGNTYAPDCADKKNQDNVKCKNLKTILTDGGDGPFNMLIPYAYNVFEIQKIKLINKESIQEGVVGKIGDVVQQLFFGAFFYAAFGVICIALVAALFMRAVYMWLYAIFSPLFALEYFFAGKMPGGDAMKAFKFNTFIGLAFVPVIVAAGLSFGLLFISAAQKMDVQDGKGTAKGVCEGTSCTLEIGGFKLTTKGLIGDNKPVGKTTEIMNPSKSLIGKVIINLIALMLLWMIVKAALASSEITKKITDPIFKFGETIAKSTPIPIPGIGKITVGGAGQILPQATSAIDTAARQTGFDYGRKFGEGVAGKMGYSVDEASKALERLKIGADGMKGNIPKQAKRANEALEATKYTAAEWGSHDLQRNTFADILQSMGIKEEVVTSVRNAKSEGAVAKAFARLDEELKGDLLTGKTNSSDGQIIQELKNLKDKGKIAVGGESVNLSDDDVTRIKEGSRDASSGMIVSEKLHITIDNKGKIEHVNTDGMGGSIQINKDHKTAGSLSGDEIKDLQTLLNVGEFSDSTREDFLKKLFGANVDTKAMFETLGLSHKKDESKKPEPPKPAPTK